MRLEQLLSTSRVIGIFFTLIAVSAVPFSAPVKAQTPQVSRDYVIGPRDVLSITVFDQADLTGKYTVEADGTFTFWIIGRVKAGGTTLQQFEAELRRKLAEGYFINPQVSVGVENYRSQRVFVMGDVRAPGEYALEGAMKLSEVLSKAGVSSSDDVIIVRPKAAKDGPTKEDDKNAEVITVDLRGIQLGRLSDNVELKNGDTIVVPRAESAYVFGFVKTPGAYPIQKDTTVMQALALAGGILPEGAINRIKIVRFVDGKKVELNKVKLTDIVKPRDTIIVPERYF